jgi:hypothetical protein
MKTIHPVPLIPAWAKLLAVLILLTGLLLGGILAAVPIPVHALNVPPQVSMPAAAVPTRISGTIASFTALSPSIYTNFVPFLAH